MSHLDARRVILIFGPSGVGKSTAVWHAQRALPDITFAPLDGLTRDLGWEREMISRDQGVCELLFRIGANQFLDLAIDATDRLQEQPGQGPVVIDVGAGFLDARRVGHWLSSHTSVVFMASPQVAYERIRGARQDPRTFKRYCEQEFSGRRKRLYRRAAFRMDADRATPAQLGEQFVLLLRQFV